LTDARPLIIGSRGSDLALWQAHFISDILARELGQTVEIKIIKTAGDRIQDLSFDKMEGKGFFTKEIEEALLAGAYRSALDLAAENGIRSVAFPNISTGVYGYPKDKAAAVAIRTVSNFLDGHPEMDKVIFVCFDEDNHRLYERRLGR